MWVSIASYYTLWPTGGTALTSLLRPRRHHHLHWIHYEYQTRAFLGVRQNWRSTNSHLSDSATRNLQIRPHFWLHDTRGLKAQPILTSNMSTVMYRFISRESHVSKTCKESAKDLEFPGSVRSSSVVDQHITNASQWFRFGTQIEKSRNERWNLREIGVSITHQGRLVSAQQSGTHDRWKNLVEVFIFNEWHTINHVSNLCYVYVSRVKYHSTEVVQFIGSVHNDIGRSQAARQHLMSTGAGSNADL